MRKHLRKVKWMVFVIIGPEFGVAMAFRQFMEAREDLVWLKKEFPDEKLSLTHVFYANMGGFALDVKGDSIITSPDRPNEAIGETTDEAVLELPSLNPHQEDEPQLGSKVKPIRISQEPASDATSEGKSLDMENGFVSSDDQSSDLRKAHLFVYSESLHPGITI